MFHLVSGAFLLLPSRDPWRANLCADRSPAGGHSARFQVSPSQLWPMTGSVQVFEWMCVFIPVERILGGRLACSGAPVSSCGQNHQASCFFTLRCNCCGRSGCLSLTWGLFCARTSSSQDLEFHRQRPFPRAPPVPGSGMRVHVQKLQRSVVSEGLAGMAGCLGFMSGPSCVVFPRAGGLRGLAGAGRKSGTSTQ